jgi:erythromycin esterase-like protein
MKKIIIIVFSIFLINNILSQEIESVNKDTIKIIEAKGYEVKKMDSIYNAEFANKIDTKQIIGLGEATHGSKEIFLLKEDIIMQLIKNKEFNVVAFEAPYAESKSINEYLLTGKGDVKLLLSRLDMWTWNTSEVL